MHVLAQFIRASALDDDVDFEFEVLTSILISGANGFMGNLC